MNKFQKNIKFFAIDDFFHYLPENELKIVLRLRKIIQSCMPNCIEKLSYNVPYYKINSNICYLWPASIPWGKVKKHGVQIGFCKGQKLYDEINYLDKSNRKIIASKTFFDIKEIDEDLLKAYLFNAIDLDKNRGLRINSR